ncbi:hypothetical protein Tco_0950251 [Tanacetum coccineum]
MTTINNNGTERAHDPQSYQLHMCATWPHISSRSLTTVTPRFQEIVDFLNGSHIRYALTKNPTIYVSLIKKFWQTATVTTIDNGEQEITATVDGKEFIVTVASIRRHLQLADVDGFSVLPTTEIFDQLSLMGPKKTYWEQFSSNIATAIICLAINRTFNFSKLIFDDKAVYVEWDDRVERATTTTASLDVEQASGNINRTQSMTIPNVLLPQGIGVGGSPRVHTLGSDEGSIALQELMILCTMLSKKVESLEADLKQTKKVYGAVYTKLIMKVKRLEKTVKTSHSRRRAKIVISDDEEDSEDSSKQVTKVLADATKTNVHTYTRRIRTVSIGSGGISTASASMPVSTGSGQISTASASMPVSNAGMVQEVNISIPSPVVVKDKEWENTRARVEADEELAQRLQAEERNKYSEVDQAKMLTEDKGRASELVTGSSQATIIDSVEVGSSKRVAEAELDHEGSKRQNTNEASGSVQEQPEEEEKEFLQEDLQQMIMVVLVEEVYVKALQVELKRLFEPNTDDTLWKLQRYMHDPLKWRLYDTCGVHHVSTERGIDIFMLVEKEYLLSKGVLTLMFVNKLLVEQHSEMANELLRKIFIQTNRPRQ